ncbi:MAG TPA: protein kinase [Gemmatimonadaceae bacterium]|jgi:tetratricopeptide (TPR) repeat protein/tRNA A-37 threonylcarbamoyl transferase component Bud32|nr:protein kinase [Gemmatimonadaceae bacterium]
MADLRDELQSSLGSAYVLERELGGGGMSRVFLAEEKALGRKVVVKVLPRELAAEVSVDRFRREIQVAARLQQAQIVPVLSAGELNGVPYYTMPFVEGESLRTRLANGARLSIHDVVGVLRDITRALAYAHERGIVHRDIKPDNVLLSGGTAVVTDFGIAKALSAAKDAPSPAAPADSSLTQLGTSVGTPTYISPEQAAGDPDVDQRADIYSLGCVAYELLTGQPPFPGLSPQKTLVAHLTEKPAPVATKRPDTPAALADLVMRCLEKDPSRRPNASEIATALDGVASGTSGSMTAAAFFAGPQAAKRGIGVYAALVVAVAVLAKAAVIALGVPDWVFVGALIALAIGGIAAVLTALNVSPRLNWSRTFRFTGGALASFVVLVAVVMILRSLGIGPAGSLLAAGKMTGRERLLVVDFNAGKDSSLSHVVTEAVRTNLGQSKVVSIMPPTAIAAALQRMQKPASTNLDLGLAREVAQREGAKAVVDGSVTPLGSGYALSLRLVSADSGGELAGFQQTVDGPSQLLDAVDKLTRKLRGRIGESLKAVRDAPALDQVTTSSLEALKKYAEGVRAADLNADYATAARLLREAVARDTTFAMAYRKLGVALGNSGMPRAQSDSAYRSALRFSAKLPDRERYLTIGSYYMSGPEPNRARAADALEHVIAIDPNDQIASINLANILKARRQLPQAESLYKKAASTPGAPLVAVQSLASTLFDEGKIDEASKLFDQIRTRAPNSSAARQFPALPFFARGQLDSADAWFRTQVNDPNPLIRAGAYSNLGGIATLRGQLTQAHDLSNQVKAAVAALRGPTPPNPLSDSLGVAYIRLWYFADTTRALHAMDAALAATSLATRPVDQRPYFSLAKAYALGGRVDAARAMLAKYDAEMRDSTLRALAVPTYHSTLAEIALAEHKPLVAVSEFWKSDSLPDGPARECGTCLYVDIGRAYDLANMPDSAITYWEHYLATTSSGRINSDISNLPPLLLRLGELYEAKGNLDKAASNFSAFITLWQHADPELQPKVQSAKKRLAAIQSRKAG